MRVVVAALPGSGKTTIMKMVQKRLPRVRIVNVGSMIYELASKELGVKDRDELRKKLDSKQQKIFQERVARKIAKMGDKDIIIDTHTSVSTPYGFFPGLSEDPAHIIKPDVIVLLEYNPSDILRRRRLDDSRKRDHEDVEHIEEHQMSSRYYGFGAALHAQCAVKYIKLRWKEKRPFEHTKVAADEIVKLFKSQRRV